PLHGRFGQGRLRAFALGTQVTWETTANSTDGKRLKTIVKANASSRNDFDASQPMPTDAAPGTLFTAAGRDSLDRLDSERARLRIAATFAPYLIAHSNVSLYYDGTRILPTDNIEHDTTFDVTWVHDAVVRRASLRIIEWKQGEGRTIHLCDVAGVPVDDLDTGPAADFVYSAYVMWNEMPEHHGEWVLANLESEPSVLGALLTE